MTTTSNETASNKLTDCIVNLFTEKNTAPKTVKIPRSQDPRAEVLDLSKALEKHFGKFQSRLGEGKQEAVRFDRVTVQLTHDGNDWIKVSVVAPMK